MPEGSALLAAPCSKEDNPELAGCQLPVSSQSLK